MPGFSASNLKIRGLEVYIERFNQDEVHSLNIETGGDGWVSFHTQKCMWLLTTNNLLLVTIYNW